jgi:hypothetical protein
MNRVIRMPSAVCRSILTLIALGPLLAGCRGDEEPRVEEGLPAWSFSFDDASLGGLPAGFTSEAGEWRAVMLPGGGRGLAQLAESDGSAFNVVLADEPECADLALSLRFRAQAGEIDQGGGPVWRALDARNYYVCRYNPLESNFRVYKVVEGVRTELGSVELAGGEGWHEIAVRCTGDRLRCSYDGQDLLDVTDATFAGPGRVGLWTKADAVTWFDDLRVRPLDPAGR